MNICPRCGKSYSSEDKFCGFCGYNLTVQINSNFVTQRALKVSDIRFNLGLVYFKEGKYSQAIETFEKILKDEPDHLQVQEMLERAREALNKTIESSTS